MDQAIRLRLLTGKPEEVAGVLRCLEEAPDYFRRTTGSFPKPSDAQNIFSTVPKGKTTSNKITYGVYLDDQMIGCADVIREYPDARSAAVGLLIIVERLQRKGLGSIAYRLVENEFRGWREIKKIVAWILRINDVVTVFFGRTRDFALPARTLHTSTTRLNRSP
jgi:hypothetical protein